MNLLHGRCRFEWKCCLLSIHMEPEEKEAFLFESNVEKEPLHLTPSKHAFFFVPDTGRSQAPHSNVAPFVSPRKKYDDEGEERKSIWKRVSGSALCKVTVIFYLLACLLVSALYVALYGGQSQKLFAASDAWIPGKVGMRDAALDTTSRVNIILQSLHRPNNSQN